MALPSGHGLRACCEHRPVRPTRPTSTLGVMGFELISHSLEPPFSRCSMRDLHTRSSFHPDASIQISHILPVLNWKDACQVGFRRCCDASACMPAFPLQGCVLMLLFPVAAPRAPLRAELITSQAEAIGNERKDICQQDVHAARGNGGTV